LKEDQANFVTAQQEWLQMTFGLDEAAFFLLFVLRNQRPQCGLERIVLRHNLVWTMVENLFRSLTQNPKTFSGFTHTFGLSIHAPIRGSSGWSS
jgi:hypothetical protein